MAPDHPEVKNVEHDFAAVFDENDEEHMMMSYIGNVTVGVDVPLQELLDLYDAVVLAYGCDSDKKLDVEGAELKGIFSAREFVAWYNGEDDRRVTCRQTLCVENMTLVGSSYRW